MKLGIQGADVELTQGQILVHTDNEADADGVMVAIRGEKSPDGSPVAYVAMSESTAYELGKALTQAAKDCFSDEQTLVFVSLENNQSKSGD